MAVASIFSSARTCVDFQRMNDVGLAGRALLAFVLVHAEGPGLADEGEVVGGAVGAQRGEHVLELAV